ncbi:MAG: arginine--tRNA ligase [Candidatus Woesearchaeota archaeon]
MTKFQSYVIKEIKRITELKDFKIEVPPDDKLGDLSFPCFQLVNEKNKNPKAIAETLAKSFEPSKYVKEVKVVGPYLNFYANKAELAKEIITLINEEGKSYGSQNIGKGKTIVIDYSSPNIAKPFGIGHLRSTVIGNSLYKTLNFLGYKCVGVNHLGDWGTQFGKLIYAYQNWGSEEELKKNSISHLFSLYVKFHQEVKTNPALEDEGRAWFNKLEHGDAEATRLWELFRKISIEEFKKYYKELNIEFDSYSGEAFYNKVLGETVEFFEKKKMTEMSEGAMVVNLDKLKIPPLMLRKSDGATTYATRDLAAAMYRVKTYKPAKMLYVVGTPQKLHFEQLFTVLSKAGYKDDMFEHINFGHLRFNDGKMSTREGNIIFLEEVLDKAIELAMKTIKEKNPDLSDKEKVAKVIGIGSVIFADLSNDRTKDIVFDWDKILNFEGETAPYIQYAYARICSIFKKVHENNSEPKYEEMTTAQEARLVKMLAGFPALIADSAAHRKPSLIARYALDLAQAFNEFYHACPIMTAYPELKAARLELCKATKQVIFNSMYLLGIGVVDEM